MKGIPEIVSQFIEINKEQLLLPSISFNNNHSESKLDFNNDKSDGSPDNLVTTENKYWIVVQKPDKCISESEDDFIEASDQTNTTKILEEKEMLDILQSKNKVHLLRQNNFLLKNTLLTASEISKKT